MKQTMFTGIKEDIEPKFKVVGDYVLLKSKEDHIEYAKAHWGDPEHDVTQVTSYPVLWSLVEGEENMSFIPLSKEDLLEMIQAIESC